MLQPQDLTRLNPEKRERERRARWLGRVGILPLTSGKAGYDQDQYRTVSHNDKRF